MAVESPAENPHDVNASRFSFLKWTISAVPLVVMVIQVVRYSVNVPFGDEWELVHYFKKMDEGVLGIGDLWAQHNEHRIFLPRLVMVAAAYMTGWNVRAVIGANLLLSIALFAFLIRRLQWDVRSSWSRGLLTVACAGMVFYPVQWENWLWGWQITFGLCIVGAVATFFFLVGTDAANSKEGWKRVALGAGGAAVSSLSLASGLVVWPAGVVVLALQRELRKWILPWVIIGLAFGVAYLTGYVKPGGHPSLTEFARQPAAFARYLLAYLGSAIFPAAGIAQVLGSAGLVFFAACSVLLIAKPKMRSRCCAWIGLGGFVILADLLTAVGRVGFGLDQATTSRYTAFSALFWLATFVLVAQVLEILAVDRPRVAAVAAALILISLLPFYLVTYSRGLESLHGRYERMLRAQACLRAVASPEDPCLLEAFPDTTVLWGRLAYARSKGWGVQSER